MAVIDTLTAKVRNSLKKTGDAMIGGFLTLFQDPTLDLHAVTKRYVDNAIAGATAFDYRQVPIVGNYYAPQWGGSATGLYGLTDPDFGLCFVAPLYVPVGTQFDQIIVECTNATTSVHRIIIYELSETTWLPTSIVLDVGTFAWTGVGGNISKAIALTAPSSLLGIGWLYESRTGVNPTIRTRALQIVDSWPPGSDPSLTTSISTAPYYRIQSTGNAPGSAPAVGTFSLVSSLAINNQKIQPMALLRRA